jgi:hypothetical protein
MEDSPATWKGLAMGIIDEYWTGVLQRLQAEVSIFNRLISHKGERGRENEQALARVLAGLIPRRFIVGTGLLFDRQGRQSKQMDIVVYDVIDTPTTLAQTTQLLFPVEEIACCIEVKTTVNAKAVQDSGEKKASILALDRAEGTPQPFFALFGFESNASPNALSQRLAGLPPEQRPDLVCVLDPGFVAGFGSVLHPAGADGEYRSGVTLLHDVRDGVRLPGAYLDAQETIKSWEERDGVVYPIVDFQHRRVLSDPSRALLLFCEALLRGITAQEGRRHPVLSHYLTEDYREIVKTRF